MLLFRGEAAPAMISTLENVSDIGIATGLCLGPPARAGVRSKRGAVQAYPQVCAWTLRPGPVCGQDGEQFSEQHRAVASWISGSSKSWPERSSGAGTLDHMSVF